MIKKTKNKPTKALYKHNEGYEFILSFESKYLIDGHLPDINQATLIRILKENEDGSLS